MITTEELIKYYTEQKNDLIDDINRVVHPVTRTLIQMKINSVQMRIIDLKDKDILK